MATAPAQTTGSAVAKRDTSNPLVQFREELEGRSNELKMALPSHISPEKFQRTVITAIQQNPELLNAKRRSLILACMKAAQDGLLPDGREAALVEFKRNVKVEGGWQQYREVAYIPMIHGIRKKILQARDSNGNTLVSSLYTGVVYRKEVESKHFYYDLQVDPPLGHRPMLDLTVEDTTDDQIVGAYSIAIMADGSRSYKFMRRFEIDKIRETSQTGATKDRQGKPRTPKGPWVDWFPQMCEKTVAKAHADSLPQSGDFIIDATNDQDFDAARSAVTLLGHGNGGEEPTLITDETPHDPETGEIIDEGGNGQPEDAGGDQAKTEPKPRARSGKAKEPEPKAAAPAEPQAQDPGVDEQTGITKDPNEAVAEQLLGEFAVARTEAELIKLWSSSELERAVLSDELHDAVSSGYHRHEKRVREAQAAPAK